MNERNFHNFLKLKTEENGSRLLFQKKDGWSWKQITWPDFKTEVESIASFLLNSGFCSESRIIVFSPNTLACLSFELAVFTVGGVCLPVRNIKEARDILVDSTEKCFLLSSQEQFARDLTDAPDTGGKLEKAFLSTNQKTPIENKVINYATALKFGFLARKKLTDRLDAAGNSVRQDAAAVIFNAASNCEDTVSLSHAEILNLLDISRKALGDVSKEDQTFSFLPSGGSFSMFANMLNLQIANRGAIADGRDDFFRDAKEIMPVLVFLPAEEIETAAETHYRKKPGSLKNNLGGRVKRIVTDGKLRDRTEQMLKKNGISAIELGDLSVAT